MLYNTGISTGIRILTNRQPEHRRGKVQLIDACAMWQKMRKRLGSKPKQLSEDQIAQITKLFGECQEVPTKLANGSDVPIIRIFNNSSCAGSVGEIDQEKWR
jgi:type I restriction enzyme M protein